MDPYPDTAAIAAFMEAFEQPVRTTPTGEITDQERLLRARLVVEEALEFAAALGCTVTAPLPTGEVTGKTARVQIDPHRGIDLVEAADAIADIVVVTKGTAHTLGIPCDAVFEEVHRTNMAKLGPDGKILRNPEDGKVLKPAGWQPPTSAITRILAAHGWKKTPDEGQAVA